MTNLGKLFDKHHCDKSDRHHYDTIYEPLFEKYRNKKTFKLLEIGILRGESMSAWVEYFPDAKLICGIDTFERVTDPSQIPILSKNLPNVKYLKGDSRTIDIPKEYGLFDVIIDDGLHYPKANEETFLNLIKYLKKDGIYVIEDVWAFDEMTKQQMDHSWIIRHKEHLNKQNYKSLIDTLYDDHRFIVERHDLRKLSGNPDSYIFTIRKKSLKTTNSQDNEPTPVIS